MLDRYKKELEELKIKMQKAEEFAKKIPAFAELILDEKLTGEEEFIKFDTKYKDLYLGWGINRGHYKSDAYRTISNYKETHDITLFSIYFNTINLYDSHEKYGLDELQNKTKLFFYDKSNSTFYIEDEYIGEFLELANEWYLQARDKEKEKKKTLKIEELEQELNKLKEASNG